MRVGAEARERPETGCAKEAVVLDAASPIGIHVVSVQRLKWNLWRVGRLAQAALMIAYPLGIRNKANRFRSVEMLIARDRAKGRRFRAFVDQVAEAFMRRAAKAAMVGVGHSGI